MPEDDRRVVAESLDPAGYVAHITRTAMAIEQLARDVAALRDTRESDARDMTDLRRVTGDTKTEFAVFKVDCMAKIGTNSDAIKELVDGLRWLRRTLVGAIIVGVASGVIAVIFQALKK